MQQLIIARFYQITQNDRQRLQTGSLCQHYGAEEKIIMNYFISSKIYFILIESLQNWLDEITCKHWQYVFPLKVLSKTFTLVPVMWVSVTGPVWQTRTQRAVNLRVDRRWLLRGFGTWCILPNRGACAQHFLKQKKTDEISGHFIAAASQRFPVKMGL